MEGLPPQQRLRRPVVEGIPHQRPSQVGEMDPYLVGAPGVEHQPQEGDPVSLPQQMEFGAGVLALGVHHPAQLQGALPQQRQVDEPLGEGHPPLDQGEVPLFHLLPQLAGGELVLGRHHRPGGILIQAVQSPEGGHRPGTGAVGGVDRGKGAVDVPPRLVAGHPGGLVVDDEVLVLVEDRHRGVAERHPFGLLREVYLQDIPGGEGVDGADMGAVEQQPPGQFFQGDDHPAGKALVSPQKPLHRLAPVPGADGIADGAQASPSFFAHGPETL